MKYLHEIIIEQTEKLIKEGKQFSAWDVTQAVNRALMCLSLKEMTFVDCPTFTDKDGQPGYNVEHSHVKSLVHLYLKNYNPFMLKQVHGPKYIVYTPIPIPEVYVPTLNILGGTYVQYDPLLNVSTKITFSEVNPNEENLPPYSTDINKGDAWGSRYSDLEGIPIKEWPTGTFPPTPFNNETVEIYKKKVVSLAQEFLNKLRGD